MPPTSPTLYMVCGKIASGKSSLTEKLGRPDGTVTISEDVWLNALYADQMHSIADYVRCADKLRDTLGPHIAALLNAGTSVVLDFPANTVETRNWMRGILDLTKAEHEMHVLDVPDAVCLARLQARNAKGDHPFDATEEQFRQVTKHHVPPSDAEGFNVILHRSEN